ARHDRRARRPHRSSLAAIGDDPPVALTDIDTARALVLDRVRPAGREIVALRAADGRIAAREAVARVAVPGFDNSAMDGFAVRAADVASAGEQAPRELRIVDESRAGRPATAEVGANIRRAGEDVREGDVLLEPGARIGPAALGALAAGGIAAVECSRRPRV